MIYALTPNPALDLSGNVENIVPNEKAYVSHDQRFPGGNAINAARIIHRLGGPVMTTGFLGGGVGQEIRSLLSKERLKHGFVDIKESSRINITVSNQHTHYQTRLSFPGPKIHIREQKEMKKLIARIKPGSFLLIGGSLPPGLTPSFISKLMVLVRAKKIPVFVDVPGPILRHLTSKDPFFIKPNLTELQEFLGEKIKTIQQVIHACRRRLHRIPLVCVSSVENGALLVSKTKAHFGTIPKIKIKSTVGAGDSMVGAITSYLWSNRMAIQQDPFLERLESDFLSDILRHGLAAASATLSHPGTLLGSAQEIRSFLPQIKIKEIL